MATTNLDSLKINMLSEAQFAGITNPNPDELFMTKEQGLIHRSTGATGVQAHTEGTTNIAEGDYSHAEGYKNTVKSFGGHVAGINNFDLQSHVMCLIPTEVDAVAKKLIFADTPSEILSRIKINDGVTQWFKGELIKGGTMASRVQSIDSITKEIIIAGGAALLITEIIDKNPLNNSIVVCTTDNPGNIVHPGYGANITHGTSNLVNGRGIYAEGIKNIAITNSTVYKITTKDNIAKTLTLVYVNDEKPLVGTFKVGQRFYSNGGTNTTGGNNYSLLSKEYTITNVADNVITVDTLDDMFSWSMIILKTDSVNVSLSDGTHVEGIKNIATGVCSHAEGRGNIASNQQSHAEGLSTIAYGVSSHAEGSGSQALGGASHAEGNYTKAIGDSSHSEGIGTQALGSASHSEGHTSFAYASQCHAEGVLTNAIGIASHTEGQKTVAAGARFLSKITAIDFLTKSITLESITSDVTIGGDIYLIPAIATMERVRKLTVATINGNIVTVNDPTGVFINNQFSYVATRINLDDTFGAAHAEGHTTRALGTGSHAEGKNTIALGNSSHAEGESTMATGTNSHAEGISSTASGTNSHAEGNNTTAEGPNSHSEGSYTRAAGIDSHAEGFGTVSASEQSHSEGKHTLAAQGNYYKITNVNDKTITLDKVDGIAVGNVLQLQGYGRSAIKDVLVSAINGLTVTLNIATSLPADLHSAIKLMWNDYTAHAEGYNTIASGSNSHAEGEYSIATAFAAHAEGSSTLATGLHSHAQNTGTISQGLAQTAIGRYNIAQGSPISVNNTDYAFIVGNGTADSARSNALTVSWDGTLDVKKGILVNGQPFKGGAANILDGNSTGSARTINTKSDYTMGNNAFSTGYNTKASGISSHAQNETTTASGISSHAEGFASVASGDMSHAGGNNTRASGSCSYSEGNNTNASAEMSHAEGFYTTASGSCSHAQNSNTIAQGKSQTVIGEYNIAQGTTASKTDADYALIVGNGTSSARSNAMTLTWDGALDVQKDVKVNGRSLQSKAIVVTLPSTSWSGTSAPYTQSLLNSNITATCPIEILKHSSTTGAQLAVLQSANIQGGTQTAGSIILEAWGDKPTIDLPVQFIIRGDM